MQLRNTTLNSSKLLNSERKYSKTKQIIFRRIHNLSRMLRLVYKHFISKHALKACKLPLKVPLATVTALVAVGVCSIPMNCRAMSTDNQKTKDKTEDKKTKDKMGNIFRSDTKPITRNDVAKKEKQERKKENFTKVDAVQSWPQYAEEIRTKYAKCIIPTEEEVDELLNMKISLWRGDITKLEIDAIVNAANNSLLGGGGVDGAIHRAAGQKLLEECCKLNGCRTGEAKITGGYKLPVKHVIHTVGPIGVDEKKLSSCYRNCLNIAKEHNIRTIAFPCISTGIYGYDIEKATPVVMKTIKDWLKQDNNMGTIDKIVFCVFLIKDVEVYESNLQIYFPVWPSKHGKGNAGQTEKKKSKLSGTTKSTPEQTESNSRHENSTKTDAGGKGETEAKETEQKASKRNNSKENNPNGDVCKDKQAELQEAVSQDENNVNVKNGEIDTDDSSPAAKKKVPNPETEKKGSTNSKM